MTCGAGAMMRDKTLWEQPVTYSAIGRTQAPDLLRYPPPGFRATQHSARVGHGEARWNVAWRRAMTWDIKRRSGFRVITVETPDFVFENTYSPVTFDDDGIPAAPSVLHQAHDNDGESLVRPGDSAVLSIGWGALSLHEPVRVVYLIEEPRRRGFAYGTLPGHPLLGEECFAVEHRPDDSVWLTVRSFSRPNGRLWWVLLPALRIAQVVFIRRYARALAGPID